MAWIVRAADVPAVGAGKTWNRGKVLTPGLVDQHTRIDYGAKRLVDFKMLSEGGMRGDLEACLIKEQWPKFELLLDAPGAVHHYEKVGHQAFQCPRY